MAKFYNLADQKLFEKYQFLPQEQYRLGLNLPTDPVPDPVVDEGIVNTNSFANSGGGNDFNPAGNAFGYGEPVSEVNVRTFNPQSNDPTGSVASAQEAYNQLGDIKDKSIYSNYADINNVIQDNRQNYGAGNTFNAAGERIGAGQFENPYEDSIDQGSTKNFTDDEETKKGFFSNLRTRARNLGSNLPSWAQTAGKTAATGLFAPQIALPVMGLQALLKKFGGGSRSGGGTYGIGGLSDDQKGFYNALSNKNALFSGQQGFKTLTGKNFNAKNYVPNQLEKYRGFAEEKYDIDDDGNITKDGKKVDFKGKSFLKNQIIESFAINKQNLINQKKRSDAFKISNTRNDPVTGTKAIQDRINREYADQMKADGRDFSVSGPDTSANKTGKSNQASSEKGYNMHGGGDGGNQNQGGDTESQTNSQAGEGGFADYAKGGRAGYFFGGRVNYKIGGVVHPDGRKGFFQGALADTKEGKSMSPGTDASGGFRGGDNDGDNNNLLPTVNVNKKINEKINERLTGMIPDRVDKNKLLFDNAKRYQTLSKNKNIPFFMNRSDGPKTINKNLYTNNLTNLNLQYPDIKIEDEYGMIDGDKAKSLIDQAVLEQTISPVEGLNLTRSIDTTGTQSNTSGDYTMGNFNFSSPDIEGGVLNSKANYNLGDLNLNANLNTNDSTINDSRLGFNYGDGALTGSTFRDNDYGYTTNKLGVDKTFDVGNNFKVGLDGDYENTIYNGENYRDSEFTPSLNYNDGTFNANLSKEIVEGGTQPNLGIGFQKNGFYGNANNLLSQDRTGIIGYQKNIGSPNGPIQFSAGGEIDPFTGDKTAGLFGKYTFKNGGLAGLL